MCQKTMTVTNTNGGGKLHDVDYVELRFPKYDEALFKPKKPTTSADLWNRFELKMIGAIVSVMEVTLLLCALTSALFSIVNPKIKSGLYSLFILLPFSLLLPLFMGRVESASAEDTLDD